MVSEIPEWLVDAAERGSRPLDWETILRRLQAAFVTDITPYADDEMTGLTIWFEDFPITIDFLRPDSSSPVADAVDEAVEVAHEWDLLRRLHSALMDMDQIVHAARQLLDSKETEEVGVLDAMHEVIETGLVTMYARHFDGDRQLPGRWWPRGKRKVTHDKLVERRNTVVAHIDETSERKLVRLPTSGEGPPVVVVGERRDVMQSDDVRELIRHCEALWRRYSDAVLQLKRDLGIGASGEPYGEETYDE